MLKRGDVGVRRATGPHTIGRIPTGAFVMPPSPIYVFPPFRLNPDARLLTANDMSVKLGGRAFDTLLALVERRDRAVSKNELLDIVWPSLVVEENNLQVQVVSLRKVLGHHAIATIPGRGYRFTLPVVADGGSSAVSPSPAVPLSPAGVASMSGSIPTSSPPPSTRTVFNLARRSDTLFGRQGDVAAIGDRIRERRVVTIAGAGGIGKTRAAEAAAVALADNFADGVWWVELAAINDPALVPTAVARALGLSLAGVSDTLQSVLARVGDRSLLLVLDNCEHLLEGVAAFVDTLISATPNVRVLLTSQEVLKTNDESVYRLGILTLPNDTTVDAVAASGAGALLTARVGSAVPGFKLTAENATAVCEICRRLDGIPLAIELAAARVPLLGIEGVRAKLDERFRMLTAGSRVVLRRHQTLRAALEWSHALLTEEERIVLRRLGVFAGGFTLESAQRVADDAEIDAWDVLEHLGGLVDKSLVLAEGEPVPRYRLLETTRLYALEQLAEAGETALATRKHAEAITTLLAALESPAKRFRTTPEDWSAAAAELDNTRVALDWAEHQSDFACLRMDLASASFMSFNFGNVIGEGLRRVLALGSRMAANVSADVPDHVRARFMLALARFGIRNARAESLDAAFQAAALYERLGDDELRYAALSCCVAIGARLEADIDGESLIAQGAAIEQEHWPLRLRAQFHWARHRWLVRQDRLEEALYHGRQQAELWMASGAIRAAHLLEAAQVGYCELAMGRVDEAEQRSRKAIAAAGDTDSGAGHALDTWMMCLALQGRHDEALAVGYRAYADLNAGGDEFMLLDGLAMIAAEQGRLRDAAITTVRSDAEFAARGFRRWPLSVEWRQRTDACLAAVPLEELARWKREAVHLPSSAAFEQVLGRRHVPLEGSRTA